MIFLCPASPTSFLLCFLSSASSPPLPLLCSLSSASSVLWLRTDAVQLAVPVGDDGLLMSGASGARPVL